MMMTLTKLRRTNIKKKEKGPLQGNVMDAISKIWNLKMLIKTGYFFDR